MSNITVLAGKQETVPASHLPRGYSANIIKALGVFGYTWDLVNDRLSWTSNFAMGLGFKPECHCDSSSDFEALLSEDSPNTHFGIVPLREPRKQSESKQIYQCLYIIKGCHLESGEDLWLEDTGKWYIGSDGKPCRAEGLLRVINKPRLKMEFMKDGYDIDSLTYLPNRQYLNHALDDTIANCIRDETSAAFLCLCVDRMELINEIYGHCVGDEVLRYISEILQARLRCDDVLTRMSGSRFGVILYNCTEAEVFIAAKRIIKTVEAGVYWSQLGPVAISCSIGGCMLPQQASNAQAATEAALNGLSNARKDSSLKVGLYTPDPMAALRRREQANSVSRVIRAIEEGKLHLAYQPVVDAKDHSLVFHECLLRMEDENGEIAPNAKFIEVAEKLGLIRVIDRYALELAVDTLCKYPEARLSLNVSLNSAEDPDWLSILADRQEDVPDLAQRLIVEITESHVATDANEARKFVELVRSMGCQVAIDDFGSGYTSFSNLRDLDISWIKLDGSFCENLLTNKENQVFIKSLVAIAQARNAKTIVEWVDDLETAELLASWGVDALQGHVFGRADTAPPWSNTPDLGVVQPKKAICG